MVKIIIPVIILAIFVSFVILEIKVIRQWKGGWRSFGVLPIVVLVLWMIFIFVGVLRDSTSHNLWPFEIVMCVVGGFVYLVLLLILRKLFHKN